jgi:hypothetical protein
MKPLLVSLSKKMGSLSDNNNSFSYTVPEYNKYINVEYQFLLEDFRSSGVNGVPSLGKF